MIIKNQLAISNIGWHPKDNKQVAKLMQKNGIKFLEVAPGLLFADVLKVSTEDVIVARNFWAEYDIKIVAMQGLLFGRPELVVFGSNNQKENFSDYMHKIIKIAALLGAGPLVFGAPNARRRGNMVFKEAIDFAAKLFRPLAAFAQDHGCGISFEPNASSYGCDFVTTLKDAITLVQTVNHPSFGLQIDTGNFKMQKDSFYDLAIAFNFCKHFHISAPFLSTLKKNDPLRRSILAAALSSPYTGYISIEMHASEKSNSVHVVERVLRLIKDEIKSIK